MAIKIDGRIVNSKSKRKPPIKKLLTLVGKPVWWIKEGELWEGRVLSDVNGEALVNAKCRHYSQAGNSPEEKSVSSSLLTINKDVY